MLDLSIYRSVPLRGKRTFSPFFPASVIFFTQVKWMYFDIIFVPQKANKVNAYYFESYPNSIRQRLPSSKHKPQCSIFRKRKIPPVPWLLLSPQRPSAFAGPLFGDRGNPFFFALQSVFCGSIIELTINWRTAQNCSTQNRPLCYVTT